MKGTPSSSSLIYENVKEKLVTHGVTRTEEGALILSDQKLFSLFVALERARQASSFRAVQAAVQKIDDHLGIQGKRHLLAFAYMYLRFSDLTPRTREPDRRLENGNIRKTMVFERKITQEEQLIGLWAEVQFENEGRSMLRVIYAKP